MRVLYRRRRSARIKLAAGEITPTLHEQVLVVGPGQHRAVLTVTEVAWRRHPDEREPLSRPPFCSVRVSAPAPRP